MSKFSKHPLIAGIVLTAFVGCMFLLPVTVSAQDVSNGEATATVQVALQVAWANDLDFGTVFQGVSQAVAYDNASAGVFTITGEPAAGVSLYCQLPDYMSTAIGDDRMVIAFSDADCAIDTSDGTGGGGAPVTITGLTGIVPVDPHNIPSGISIGTSAADVNIISLYVGGTVHPTVDQKAGAYIGDLILTVAYNGL